MWVDVEIHKKSGANARDLEMYCVTTYGSGFYYTTGDTLADQQAVDSVISVGAVGADDSGHDTTEDFSSWGPSTLVVNPDNTTPGYMQQLVTRDSLDVCGIDGVATEVGNLGKFGNPFYGTSAAAPHIAGIAALLLSANSTFTPAQIQNMINSSAVDIDSSGYDQYSGYGLADASALVDEAPLAVHLLATSDHGVSNSDGITNLDNSAANEELQFQVDGAFLGAAVTLYDGDGSVIGTGTGNGGSITITTNGTHDLADGSHVITARQQVSGGTLSPQSPGANIQIDTIAPVVLDYGLYVGSSVGTVWSANFPQIPGRNGQTELPWQVNNLVVSFSEDVVGLDTDMSLYGERQQATVLPDGITGNDTNMVSWTKYGAFANDLYTVTISTNVMDIAGNHLASSYTFALGVVSGDANLSGNVTGIDFLIWQRNYLHTGTTYASGDFTGDGNTDGSDFLIWQRGYMTNGWTLPSL